MITLITIFCALTHLHTALTDGYHQDIHCSSFMHIVVNFVTIILRICVTSMSMFDFLHATTPKVLTHFCTTSYTWKMLALTAEEKKFGPIA